MTRLPWICTRIGPNKDGFRKAEVGIEPDFKTWLKYPATLSLNAAKFSKTLKVYWKINGLSLSQSILC